MHFGDAYYLEKIQQMNAQRVVDFKGRASKPYKASLSKNKDGERMKCPVCGIKDIEIEGIATGVPTSEFTCNKCGHIWTD